MPAKGSLGIQTPTIIGKSARDCHPEIAERTMENGYACCWSNFSILPEEWAEPPPLATPASAARLAVKTQGG
jgi:hypothetical protein